LSGFRWFFGGCWPIGFLRVWIICFSDLDRFRLLIQSCERCRGFGSFFVRGVVLPDEGEDWPTNGFLMERGRRGAASGRGPKKAAPLGAAAKFLVRAIINFFSGFKREFGLFFPGFYPGILPGFSWTWILVLFFGLDLGWPFGFSDTDSSHRINGS